MESISIPGVPQKQTVMHGKEAETLCGAFPLQDK